MENSIVKHPMSNKMGLEIFNYMMETSRRILELSEISRNSDIGVADELNLIANNIAHHANTILLEYCDPGVIETIVDAGVKQNCDTERKYEALNCGFRSLQQIGRSATELKEFINNIGIREENNNERDS